MTKNKQTECFERIAFECELREHPTDKNAAKAFTDWLQEHDYTPMGAKRFVARIVREGIEQRQVEDVNRHLAGDPGYREVLNDVLRSYCEIPVRAGYELIVEKGGKGPVWSTDAKPPHDPAHDTHDNRDGDGGDLYELRFSLVVHKVRIGALWIMHAVGAELQRRTRRPARRRARRA